MSKLNRLKDRKKRDYFEDANIAVSTITQEEIRISSINFDYQTLEISTEDKKNLLDIEKDMLFQGKKLGDTALKIGENLNRARGIFSKYSTDDSDLTSFVKWYTALGLTKDQVYLFSGRYKLCLSEPKFKDNILVLSDRAIKEVINKKTPKMIVEKVLSGELKTGLEIKNAREQFEISSVLEISNDLESELIYKKLELKNLKKEIKLKELELKNLIEKALLLEQEINKEMA
ncbi:hypothetical protein H3N56_13160 [Cetobacterium sp. 2A]|uniref:hypothetical protein n=1 Tax=unclassified Cetobacterium TaxID=2630983 RepID=UPI00163C1B2F|nr:hypothetical protein [Cetobacterium sp. 2A]MBC2857384.1 hypothetical protein [Cetobacterium sp. 2A]